MLALLVEHGADINAESTTLGSTPFSAASADIEKICFLHSLGADPYLGDDGQLRRMPWTSSFTVTRFLFELGFDPTLHKDGCPSFLSQVSHCCDWKRLKLFSDSGIELASLGWTPLMRAIVLSNVNEVAALLKRGADLAATDFWSRTPFLLSICSGDVSKAQLLLDAGASLEERGHCAESCLDCAVLSQSPDMLRWILSLGVDANLRGCNSQTALMTAAEEGAAFAAEILIEHKANILAVDDADLGIQAVNCASSPAVMKLLAAGGANVDYLDGTGSFPLKAAVEARNFELVRCLIELSANVNMHNFGQTALHVAANYDEIEIMQLLLAAGADPNAAEEDGGWRPLWLVKSREAAKALIEGGPNLKDRDDFGTQACDHQTDLDIRELLTTRRLDVNYSAMRPGSFRANIAVCLVARATCTFPPR